MDVGEEREDDNEVLVRSGKCMSPLCDVGEGSTLSMLLLSSIRWLPADDNLLM